MAEGSREDFSVDAEVVSRVEVRGLRKQVRELQGVLDKKRINAFRVSAMLLYLAIMTEARHSDDNRADSGNMSVVQAVRGAGESFVSVYFRSISTRMYRTCTSLPMNCGGAKKVATVVQLCERRLRFPVSGSRAVTRNLPRAS